MSVATTNIVTTEGLVWCTDFQATRSINTGNNYNNAVLKYPGYFQNAGQSLSAEGLVFDGTNGIVSYKTVSQLPVADDNAINQTWEVFAKSSSSASQSVFGHKASQGCSYYCNGGIIIRYNKWCANWYDNSSYNYEYGTGADIVSDEWYHVVVTSTSNAPSCVIRLYVNGVLQYTSGDTNLDYSSGGNWMALGQNYHTSIHDYFQGTIMASKYYQDKALSLEEVKNHYRHYKSRI